MTESQQDPVSESQIAVHWREEEYIYPPQSFIDQANANDPAIFDRFDEKNFPDCFVEYAELLSWDKKWDTVLDSSNPPFWKWFTGGRLNASYNCVDRVLAAKGDKDGIILVAELPVVMLACARLGVVHSEVFGGFSANACGTRIDDSGSRVLITMDGYI